MKNRFFLITLAILSMGLFVTSNVRAEDERHRPPQVQPQAQPQGTDDGGAHQRDPWGRFHHAR